MQRYKVSVITVCLNSVKTIEQTIQSVINQSYPDIEYIVVDGQSTDGTLDIIKRYEDKISKWVSEPDCGLYDAMNKGIEMSTGDIIGIINSDDRYDKDAVKHAVEAFAADDADIVYGRQSYVHMNGHISQSKNAEMEELKYRMVIPHIATFVKKDVYARLGTYDLQYRIAADYDFFLRAYENQVRIKSIEVNIAFFSEGGLSTANAIACADETNRIAISHAVKRGSKEDADRIEQNYKRKINSIRAKEKAFSLMAHDKEKTGSIVNAIVGGKKLKIFGAGVIALECCQFLESLGQEVTGFLDNDKRKHNTWYLGKRVEPCMPQEKDSYIVIGVMDYNNEITEQLQEMGYFRGEDFCQYFNMIDMVYAMVNNENEKGG